MHWPPPEIAFSRWSAKNEFLVDSIAEDNILDDGLRDWRKEVFTWDELQLIPGKWKGILKQSRGVYFILDEATKKGYVGSASGRENIYGR